MEDELGLEIVGGKVYRLPAARSLANMLRFRIMCNANHLYPTQGLGTRSFRHPPFSFLCFVCCTDRTGLDYERHCTCDFCKQQVGRVLALERVFFNCCPCLCAIILMIFCFFVFCLLCRHLFDLIYTCSYTSLASLREGRYCRNILRLIFGLYMGRRKPLQRPWQGFWSYISVVSRHWARSISDWLRSAHG